MCADQEFHQWWNEANRKMANGEDVDWDTRPEDPGWTLEHTANEIVMYCKEHCITPNEMRNIFNAGIVSVQGTARAKIPRTRITPKPTESA